MEGSPPGSSVHGIFQVRILDWVDISCSTGSSRPRDQIHISCIFCVDRLILYHWATWEALCVCVCVCVCMCVLVAQPCPTIFNSMDCSLPGSSVHGILQVRILEWVTIPFSSGSSWPRDQTQVSCITGTFFTIWAIREALTFCIWLWNHLSLLWSNR